MTESFAIYESLGFKTIPVRNGTNVRAFQHIKCQEGSDISLSRDGRCITLQPGRYAIRGISVVQRLHPGVPVPADTYIGYSSLVKASEVKTVGPHSEFLSKGTIHDPALTQISQIDDLLEVGPDPLTFCMIVQYGETVDGLLAMTFSHPVTKNHVYGRLVIHKQVVPAPDAPSSWPKQQQQQQQQQTRRKKKNKTHELPPPKNMQEQHDGFTTDTQGLPALDPQCTQNHPWWSLLSVCL